ncbi:TPA: hypothetical protein ACH3X1_003687 [Trebouxia sp. C0004]
MLLSGCCRQADKRRSQAQLISLHASLLIIGNMLLDSAPLAFNNRMSCVTLPDEDVLQNSTTLSDTESSCCLLVQQSSLCVCPPHSCLEVTQRHSRLSCQGIAVCLGCLPASSLEPSLI